MNISVSLV